MILLVAVIAGLVAVLIRSWISHEKFISFNIQAVWLVFAAFLPQYLAFSLPATRERIPDSWIPFILIGSQLLLLAFVWVNRKKPGMWAMGVGLFLNFLVISLNHGFMPLSPDTAQKLIEPGVTVSLTIGERVGYGKDILLPIENTKLWFLSDIFLVPQWLNYRTAFSVGDILISVGSFLFLWSLGDSSQRKSAEVKNAENI